MAPLLKESPNLLIPANYFPSHFPESNPKPLPLAPAGHDHPIPIF